MSDKINHPSHYTQGSIETIEIIKAMTENLTGFDAYIVGNCVKYLSRYKYKNGVEDLKKCAFYLQRLIDEQEPTKEYKPKEGECDKINCGGYIECMNCIRMKPLNIMADKLDDIEYIDTNGNTKKLGLG